MMSKLQKSVSDAVQTFREVQNLLPTLYTHISALENTMTQKITLAGAARRREHCFADPFCSFFVDSDDEGALVAGSSDGTKSASVASLDQINTSLLNYHQSRADMRCARVTTAVATAPLGVLAVFPLSTTQHLVAQHQRDEEELLGVISRITQQSWPQKVEQLKAKAALVETLASAIAERPSTAHALLTSFLLTPAQLCVAVYGLVACAIKMGSVLQEAMLALRKDTRGCLLSSPHVSIGATVLADYLAAVFAREGQLRSKETALLSLHDVDNSRARDGAQSAVGQGQVMSPAHPPASPEPLTLVEAVGMLEAFMKSRWCYCRNVYLAEESHILLANA